jgi:hypothetical protein
MEQVHLSEVKMSFFILFCPRMARSLMESPAEDDSVFV